VNLVIGAGGSGGHIIPALAVAAELRNRGWQVAFIGNKASMEERLTREYSFPFYPISVQKLYRKFTLANLAFPFLLMQSILKCKQYYTYLKPQAVFCTGGFVAGPVAVAAARLHLPLYFQDGNSYPGLTTRSMAGKSKHVFIANTEARQYLLKADCLLTGNPLLAINKLDKQQIQWAEFSLRPQLPTVFITGGSQGSAILNAVVAQSLQDMLNQSLQVIWQTGKNEYIKYNSRYGYLPNVHIFDFTNQMHVFYSMADVAVSRAGALSIAELEAYKIPAVFVPLPTAAENHQFINAQSQVKKRVALLLEQQDLTKQTLLNSVQTVLASLPAYTSALLAIPENTATQQIADLIVSECGGGR